MTSIDSFGPKQATDPVADGTPTPPVGAQHAVPAPEHAALVAELRDHADFLHRVTGSSIKRARETRAANTIEAQAQRIADLEAQLAAANARAEKAVKVVTMCGSSRFVDVMAVCAWLIERNERAVTMGLHLLPDWYCTTPDHLAEHEGVADEMDELHINKISLSDEIFVVNVNGYIGESTTREVEFAKSKGIPVRWFTHDKIGHDVTALAALDAAKEGK